MPYEYLEFTKVAKQIRILHKNVKMVLKDYNYIIAGIFLTLWLIILSVVIYYNMPYVWNTGLSKQEVQLFCETLNTCVKIIDPLVFKYTWSQLDSVNKYLPSCYEHLESVKFFFFFLNNMYYRNYFCKCIFLIKL